MKNEIMRQCGFEKEVEFVENKQYPFCNKQLKGVRAEFKEDLSFKEFKISGLCQSCQDEIFG